VANFETSSSIPADAWRPVLNHVLPNDIRIVASEEVPLHFHARYSATGKSYKYVILNRSAPSAIHRSHAWHVDRKLNLRAMRRAAGVLIGRHNFSSFRSSQCGATSPVRTLTALAVKERGEFIEILLEADAFLMHMARNIVGTLVDVGLGRYSREDVKQMLLSYDRSKAGRTAPAHGLYLISVSYS
jgi:tRNA pseudouridine38-40 synthase